MRDYSRSIDAVRWLVPKNEMHGQGQGVGTWELVRLAIPNKPLYEIKTIWQGFQWYEPGANRYILCPDLVIPGLRWSLRFTPRSTQAAPPFVSPITPGNTEVPFSDVLPAWPDREVLSDWWGSTVEHSIILSGQGWLRMFVTIPPALEGMAEFIFGSRLRGCVFEGIRGEDESGL